MVVYRHKLWLKNIRSSFADRDFENLKMVALFIATLGIMSFFSIRIVDTLNQGVQAEQRTALVEKQVSQLEKENEILKAQKEIAVSDSEIEAQYRALGHKKPGESIYIVSKEDLAGIKEVNAEAVKSTDSQKSQDPNWQKWLLLIFKN